MAVYIEKAPGAKRPRTKRPRTKGPKKPTHRVHLVGAGPSSPTLCDRKGRSVNITSALSYSGVTPYHSEVTCSFCIYRMQQAGYYVTPEQAALAYKPKQSWGNSNSEVYIDDGEDESND